MFLFIIRNKILLIAKIFLFHNSVVELFERFQIFDRPCKLLDTSLRFSIDKPRLVVVTPRSEPELFVISGSVIGPV